MQEAVRDSTEKRFQDQYGNIQLVTNNLEDAQKSLANKMSYLEQLQHSTSKTFQDISNQFFEKLVDQFRELREAFATEKSDRQD